MWADTRQRNIKKTESMNNFKLQTIRGWYWRRGCKFSVCCCCTWHCVWWIVGIFSDIMGFVPNINICYALRYSAMGEKYRIAPNMGKQEILQGEKQNIKCQGLILSIVLWTSIRHQLTEFWMSEVGSDQISCKMFKIHFCFLRLLITALQVLSDPSPIILATLDSSWLLL